MVTWYEFALWVHVFAAVVLVGGALVTQAYGLRILRTGDRVRLAGFAKDTEWIGMRIYMPSSILLLAFGIVLVEEGGWGYPFWVIFGLAVIGLSIAVGAGFFGPESGRIGKLVEAHGVEHPEVQARIKRILRLSRIELALLIAVVFDMVIKPFD